MVTERKVSVKGIIKSISFIFMILLLTGCMKINMYMQIESDKTITVSMEALAKNEMFFTATTSANEYIEKIQDQILTNDNITNVAVTPIVRTIDGASWTGVKVTGEFSKSSVLAVREVIIDGKEGLEITFSLQDLEDEMGVSDLTLFGYSPNQLKQFGAEMNLTVTMPGPVTANVGEVNGNTVTIDLLDLLARHTLKDIVISSPIDGKDWTIWYVIIAVVVVFVIEAFLQAKKKH